MGYRVLSLDGGGSWALIQVKTLIDLYGDVTGHSVLQDFDLAAANSGGSIVLGGLVCNFRLSKLLDLFQQESVRREIFSPSSSWSDWVVRKVLGVGPKYSTTEKLIALRNELSPVGDEPLPEAVAQVARNGRIDPLRILIIGFDYDRNHAMFFRSSPTDAPGLGKGDASEVTLAEAIHASTNAPVNYFDAPAVTRTGDRYWDGAITGCNNPVLVAVTEAVCAGAKPEEIVALSLGTGTVALPWPADASEGAPLFQTRSKLGLIPDLKKLAGAILDDPPDMASFLAHVQTGLGSGVPQDSDSRIVRMNPLVSPIGSPQQGWSLPGSMSLDEFTYLASLDMDAVDDKQVAAIGKYTDLWLNDRALNQPIRMNHDTLKREIGQERYSEAKRAWLALSCGGSVGQQA